MGRIQEFFKGNQMMDLGDFDPRSWSKMLKYCTNFNVIGGMADYFQDGAIQLILYKSGGGLAETGLDVPHLRP